MVTFLGSDDKFLQIIPVLPYQDIIGNLYFLVKLKLYGRHGCFKYVWSVVDDVEDSKVVDDPSPLPPRVNYQPIIQSHHCHSNYP